LKRQVETLSLVDGVAAPSWASALFPESETLSVAAVALSRVRKANGSAFLLYGSEDGLRILLARPADVVEAAPVSGRYRLSGDAELIYAGAPSSRWSGPARCVLVTGAALRAALAHVGAGVVHLEGGTAAARFASGHRRAVIWR
jgi:hypothetical protein